MSDEIRKLIQEAAEKARRETSHEPEPQFTGEVRYPVECQVGRGLEGAIVTDTKVGYVNGAKGWLVYRGFDCFDLAEHSTFEETTYLLFEGKLPNRSELQEFSDRLKSSREVPGAVYDHLRRLPITQTHPMSALRTAVSILGNLDPDADDVSVAKEKEVSIQLVAQFATLVAAIARLRRGESILAPRNDLGHAENLLYMMTGNEPDATLARVMDIMLILHADHGMNASTFSTMVVNSSLSDMYGSVVAGIASLKGPLHGGANEKVLYDLEEIGDVSNVQSWFTRARETKRKINGFGHRVYKAYDPRARILGPIAQMITDRNPETRRLYEVANQLEKLVSSELGTEKKIFPNVDFYSGLVYSAMGIETAMFTPIFALARVPGWTARTLEYLADNRIFRPRAVYTGPSSRDYVPIDQR